MRISEFILRDEGPEARGKEFLAFSLKSAAGGRSSNLFQGNTARSEFFRDLKTLHEHEHVFFRPPSAVSGHRSAVLIITDTKP